MIKIFYFINYYLEHLILIKVWDLKMVKKDIYIFIMYLTLKNTDEKIYYYNGNNKSNHSYQKF